MENPIRTQPGNGRTDLCLLMIFSKVYGIREMLRDAPQQLACNVVRRVSKAKEVAVVPKNDGSDADFTLVP